jgi:hypothetical protein
MVFFYSFELEIKDSTDTASQIHTLNYTLKLTARTKRCDKRDDFDFPLWIFHLYVATFQHHK